jgi:uncharacterized phiE125 gp8 family phage protein
MNWSLKQINSPSVEPVSLYDALDQCHADEGVEDSFFLSKIKAGRTKAEEYQRRSYINQTWELSFDKMPSGVIELPRSPVISIESIICYDENGTAYTLNLFDFSIDLQSEPARIALKSSKAWPAVTFREFSALVIQYKAGYGATSESVPEPIKDAILIYVSHQYNNRASETELPQAFYDLLKPNRLYI